MSDEHDTNLDRRSFLKNSAVGAFGFTGWAVQDGDGQDGENGSGDRPLYVRRMVFPFPERLDGDLRRKIIIMTDRKDTRPDSLEDVNVDAVDNCNFSGDWPPAELNVWEGIIVDWKNAGRMVGFYGGNPTVEATQLVERNTIFVENQPTNIPLGTPFIVDTVDKCPGDLVGVEATKVPGIEVQTGPGESTGEATNDR
ncbi:hypothetical protein [Halorussus aquaticus]|uniref:Tat (Twin-arginine translocation) pathway signal sequence n=1 Tax=Halorussus aquaticus TaxID=2953748 RepID=A0ABD5Q5B8_9EURY|nr:hypothetical protein [Halorussus aquaticus]